MVQLRWENLARIQHGPHPIGYLDLRKVREGKVQLESKLAESRRQCTLCTVALFCREILLVDYGK